MKRIFALMIALMLLLAACNLAGPDQNGASGEENGFAWRVLDLEHQANAELRAWIEGTWQQYDEEFREYSETWSWRMEQFYYHAGIPWGNSVYTTGETPHVRHRKIMLRDPATGQETILLQSHCALHSHEQYEDCGEFCAEGPRFIRWIDDRYFIYTWFQGEYPTGFRATGFGVFDIQTKQAHFVTLDDAKMLPTELHDGMLFWENGSYGAEGPFQGHIGNLNLFTTDLAALPALEFTDLLAGIAHEPVQEASMTHLMRDQQFYAVGCIQYVTVFDLQRQVRMQLSKHDLGINFQYEFGDHDLSHLFFEFLFARDDNTLIWASHPNDTRLNHVAVEITLP